MTTRMSASILGVLAGVTYAAVAVAQGVPDCQATSDSMFQAAHDQYEREIRACNKQSACLQDSYNRWITASNKARQVGATCKAATPKLQAETPKVAPTSPAPGPSAQACYDLRNRLSGPIQQQYDGDVRGCKGNPECLQQVWTKYDQASKRVEQATSECLQGRADFTHIDAGANAYNNPDYGKVLPAMKGQVPYGGTIIYITTAAGHIVGQGVEGPVKIRSNPPVFSRAMGIIETASAFKITKLWDMRGQEVDPPEPIMVPIHK